MAKTPFALPLIDGQPVHFHEAIAAAQQRGVVLPDVYYGQLQGVARQLAFSIAGITAHDQLVAVKASLDKALATGMTFKQWQREQAVKDLALPAYRLETIFRTNIQGAYQAGRWEHIERHKQRRPYLLYDAINDARVRPGHLAMDGIILPADHPFWRTHAPLNGYNCRCGLISLTEAQAQARSKVPGTGLTKPIDDAAMQPDPGFDYAPRDRLHGVNQARDKRLSDGDTVLNSALTQHLAQDMKIIELDHFTHVQSTLEGLAARQPDWFPHGFNGIHAVSNPELFAAFDPAGALFYLSAADDLVPGFAPAQALSDAITKLAQGEGLTFNQEYAVETLWHEIMHGRTNIAPTLYPLNKEPLEEGIVQLASRYSYPALISALGGIVSHQAGIVSGGIAYPTVTGNLRYLIESARITQSEVVELVMVAGWRNQLKEWLAARLGISSTKVGYLLNQAQEKSLSAFKAKVDVQIRNARNNKGAP